MKRKGMIFAAQALIVLFVAEMVLLDATLSFLWSLIIIGFAELYISAEEGHLPT